MSSLGISVGHTGGSLLAEAMIAARGISLFKGGGHGFNGKTSSGSTGSSQSGMMSGGLSGVVGRKFNQSVVGSATQTGGNAVTGKLFKSSLAVDEDLSRKVISSVAQGNTAHAGSITGDIASKSLSSYLGELQTRTRISNIY